MEQPVAISAEDDDIGTRIDDNALPQRRQRSEMMDFGEPLANPPISLAEPKATNLAAVPVDLERRSAKSRRPLH
jgi:hypothetical protein